MFERDFVHVKCANRRPSTPKVTALRDGKNSPITTMMFIKFTNGPITSISELCLCTL